MAAVASAVIGAPLSGVIIMLELTMSYEFALAAMLSVMVSLLVSNQLFGHSFFDRQLADRGIDVSLGRGHIEMMETPVASVASQDFPRIDSESEVEPAIRTLVEAEATEAYVLDDKGLFRGKISLHKLLAGAGPQVSRCCAMPHRSRSSMMPRCSRPSRLPAGLSVRVSR